MKAEATHQEFLAAVEREFEFLVSEYRYRGPSSESSFIRFVGGNSPTKIDIMYVLRESYIGVALEREVDGVDRHCDLLKLYVLAGLGARQHVRDRTANRAGVNGAVESVAAACRKLMPIVEGPDGDKLFLGSYRPSKGRGRKG